MRAISCQVWKLFWSDIRIATTRLCDVTMIQYEKLVNKNIACYLATITTVAFIVPSESSYCTTICFVVFQHYFFLVDHIQKFLYVAFSLRTPFIPLMCNLLCEINYTEQSFTWWANTGSFSASREISRSLWSPKAHYRLHKSPAALWPWGRLIL